MNAQASSSHSSPPPQTLTQAASQPAYSVQPGFRTIAMQPGLPYTTYPSFAASSSHGHFPYSTAGAYAYAYPAPGTVPYGTPYVPNGAAPVGTLPYGASQPTYHPHLYSYQSFGSPANYYVGMYSALNSSGAAGKKQTKKKASTWLHVCGFVFEAISTCTSTIVFFEKARETYVTLGELYYCAISRDCRPRRGTKNS